jgi:hypothetical protein
MYDLSADVARNAARLAHLKRRYTKVTAMREADPDRFAQSPFGPRHQTRDERYTDILRHLRLSMSEIWEPRDTHRIQFQERLASCAEHVLRTRAMAAASVQFPLLGGERLVWERIDRAHTLIREAIDLVENGDRRLPPIGDIEVYTIEDAA